MVLQCFLSVLERFDLRYQDRGYIMSYIRSFDGLMYGDVTAHVVEGKINKVNVQFVDEEGNEKKRGNATPHSFIRRELSFVVRLFRDRDDQKLDLIYETHCPVFVQCGEALCRILLSESRFLRCLETFCGVARTTVQSRGQSTCFERSHCDGDVRKRTSPSRTKSQR